MYFRETRLTFVLILEGRYVNSPKRYVQCLIRPLSANPTKYVGLVYKELSKKFWE